MDFSHLDSKGRARMVDVSAKDVVRRTAIARGEILLNSETIKAIKDRKLPKGDVLTVAMVAGINAAKKTGSVIPLCHPVILDQVDVTFEIRDERIIIESTAVCAGRTGVEMEALSAVSGAALGIYDMCKAVDKKMSISDIRLVKKLKEPMK
ncbi:MAG: cyclic pyranopterin monophosphate synthase MoaC [Spirochaetaceae bacterium]|nr:cyclic pyranopterin monophosphate synthase MoaC [Spirochaetaceae bacterium]